MNKDEVINEIKSKGYWEINIHPEIYNEARLEITKLEDIMQKAVVSLRGWDYPHLYGRDDETESPPYPIVKGIEKYIYWPEMGTIEFWRMMQSANFVHLFSNRFDWDNKLEYFKVGTNNTRKAQRKTIGVIDTLYSFTEIFLFAKRLALQDIFGDKIVIIIKLYDLYERELVIDTPNKMGFSWAHVAKISEPWTWDKIYAVGELIEHYNMYALDAFRDFVYLFRWKPVIGNLKDDQQKFLQGKL